MVFRLYYIQLMGDYMEDYGGQLHYKSANDTDISNNTSRSRPSGSLNQTTANLGNNDNKNTSSNFSSFIFRFLNAIKKFIKSHKVFASIIAVVILAVLIAIGIMVYHDSTSKTSVVTSSSEYQGQLSSLKKTVSNKPNDAAAHSNYAVALYATGNLREAAVQYQDAINISPNDAVAYNNLANTERDLHDYSKAVAAYNKAIALNSTAINPYVNLANVQLYNLNKPNEAITTYKNALQALPNNTQIELLLGITYEAKGDNSSAKSIYGTILSQDANNVTARERLKALTQK